LLKNVAESLAEAFELGPGETAGGAAGTDAGMEEALVGIDVADSGEQGLVEERSLDGELAAAEESGELGGGDGKGFVAGRVEGRSALELAELQAAEAAGIDEAKFAAA
jgi:hypothetical protein